MRISFISKVTRVHKAMKVANNTSLCSTILVLFLEFIPVDRAEISHVTHHRIRPGTEPARLPGSYEEAPRQVKFSRLGRGLKPCEKILKLADNINSYKILIIVNISTCPGAKFFTRDSVTLRRKKRKIVRVFFNPFSSSIGLQHNFFAKILNTPRSFTLFSNDATL